MCILTQRGVATCIVFFFNDTATTEIYTLSLHDALPIYRGGKLTRERTPGRDVFPREVGSAARSEEHTSELQSQSNLVCRLLLEKKKRYEVSDDCVFKLAFRPRI